jgi:hypothetical protein
MTSSDVPQYKHVTVALGSARRLLSHSPTQRGEQNRVACPRVVNR